MKGLIAALWAENLKVRRSKIFLLTILFFSFMAVMMGLLMFAVKHPEIAGRSMTMSAKASVIGKADWPSFFRLLIQSILAIGPMGFGIVSIWIFGREYSDRVAKDLLALPVSRFTIVISKFIVIIIWSILLSLVLFFFGLMTGLAVNIDGWSGETAWNAFFIYEGSAILTMLLCTPVAFITNIGRGYLLPMGYVILTLLITQLLFLGVPGVTIYFPWAVPALFSGLAGPAIPHAGTVSYIILGITSLSGLYGTIAWWSYADQT